MTMQKFYTLESLVQAGRTQARQCETVSFDLFDTLLIRRIHDPDLVKLPVARYIADLAAQRDIRIRPKKVQYLRDSIEKRHRQKTAESFEDHEACYPRFMQEVLEDIFQDAMGDDLLQQVTDYELAMENRMLVPRKQLVDWLFELAHQGKKILVISDIYLPSSHLKVLVEYAGFLDVVEDVVSSADTFLAKASGLTFKPVEQKYGLTRSKWLHVGDNPISDGLRPSEFGIRSLVLHDASEMQRKAIVKRYFNYGQGVPLWRGRALQQLMQPHEGENSNQPPLYNEGYNFLAPMIGGFVQHIAEQCRKLDIKKVFFLSREGWTFKQFWEKSIPQIFPDNNLPEIEYLYVSRMALAGPSCAYQGLTPVNANIGFLPPGNKNFKDLCRIFSLDLEPLTKYLQEYGLSSDSCLNPLYNDFVQENSKRFRELLDNTSFQNEIKSQTRPLNDAMMLYFEEAGLFKHKRVAIVDIGWLGTIQRFLFESIKHRQDTPQCFGYLFAATRGIPYPTAPNNSIEGVIYDKDRFQFSASSILYARDLFEEACRAPHPTLNGYRLTADGYELEFRTAKDKTGKAEKEQDNYYAPLQRGILDAAPRYGAASSLLGFSIEDYRPWYSFMLVSKMAFAKTDEIVNIRHKHHLDDFHGSSKPDGVRFKQRKELWDLSGASLRFSPFLRIRLFLRHLRERIRE